MAKNSISKISNAFSTGGGGVNFEQQIQAMFLLSLLIDGFCPAMNEQTKKVHFQAKHLGHDVDDLVVITYRNQSEGKMACQIKHSITATEKDKTFQEVICAAWNDFNKEDFDRDRDRIALVTAQISNKAQQSLRFLHVEAIGAIDAEAFMERIDVPVFSNNDNQKMLVAIKECISLAKGCEPTNEEVWKFCKAFILLLFDMDCAESVNRALSASLINIISVDIFSEGVDVPEINQVIMLRPTESPIVFIQQLGRGLRKAENKEYVVVLDFIGNYRNNFMIPIALSGDRSYNKDNIRRYVTEGGRVIPGASTIHFDEISRKRIFQAIDNANFSDIKLIRENYTNLKNKLGHIPALADFDKYGEMDVLRIFDNNSLGSYYKFLVKYEKEYTIRLSEDEEKAIEFISKKLACGKRIHELELLKRTL